MIIAVAALLLSGGVFMKVNNVYNISIDALIETVTAGADPTLTIGPDGFAPFPAIKGIQKKETCVLYIYTNGQDTYYSTDHSAARNGYRPNGMVTNAKRWWCSSGDDSCVIWVCHIES